MKKQPLFSITTPTYNRAHTLGALYQSIKSQTFKDFEWIIGDDGSTDNTAELVKLFIKDKKVQIKYIQLQHAGKHHACTEMDRIATGKYIIPIDSDDTLAHNGVLQEIQDSIKDAPQNASICGCFINQNGKVFPKFDGKYYDITHDNFFDLLVYHPDRLNVFGVLINGSYDKDQTTATNESMNHYPEIVSIARNAYQNKNFYRRVFNKIWYKYNMYNPDSITSNLRETTAPWYEHVDMINLFYEYGLEKKYKTYVQKCLDDLWQKRWFGKSFTDTYTRLKNPQHKRYIVFHKIMKHFILIHKTEKRFKVYLFGFKLFSYTRHKQ